MPLLDLYQTRFGTAIRRQGNGFNGPCPLCGGEPGKSDRFVVWPDRDDNLGETCAKNRIVGIWSCRQCGRSGDTIAYLMQVDGLDFKAALSELGIEGGRAGHRRRSAPQEPRRESAFTPRQWDEPSPAWQTYAQKLLDEATDRMASEPRALAWLAGRGISAEAVATYRIGYLPAEGAKYPGRWRSRSALGLAPRTGDDGRVRDKIFIPRGIVIPSFGPDGCTLLNLRIRRHSADLATRADGKPQPKYMELEGSCKAPLLLRSTAPAALAAYFVTEAELDAMLIHHATGGVVGAVAVRTNRGKPDVLAHAHLTEAVRVCVALDYDAELDADGREVLPADAPGTLGLDFWERIYPQYRRWPTPEGKDPGDAFRLGVDIRAWVASGLPPTVKLPASFVECRQDGGEPRSASAAGTTLPASESECPAGRGAERHLYVQVDALASGLLSGGEGAAPENPEPQSLEGREQQTRTSGDEAPTEGITPNTIHGLPCLSDDDRAALMAALPAYVNPEGLHEDVARAWLLWRGVPATFHRLGNGGFSWTFDHAWVAAQPERFNAFWRFQNASPRLWQWLSEHADTEITSRNLLHILG